MKLIDAMQHEDARTENGALTHSTSSDYAVDLFFQINAMRARSDRDLIDMFIPALEESPLDAMKILFYSRDVRGGQGERRAFRIILRYLAENYPEVVRPNIALIPEYGRWDDVLELVDTPLEDEAFALIKHALLEEHDGLCAKWMPREKSSKRRVATKLRNYLGLSPKRYRKLLVEFTRVVEQAMCANNWEGIVYEHVPSYAMKNYRKAFARHDEARWQSYVDSLNKGEAKVNAATLYPHDVVRPFLARYGGVNKPEGADLLNAQWKALPNYMVNNDERVIPVCDVSGSMSGTPMEVSIALGLYISERNKGPFKDAFITFSANPKLQVVHGNHLHDRVRQLATADWGMNTNLEAVFELVLDKAVRHNVPENEMPTMILILSDMEFDRCVRGGQDMTLMNNIRVRYEEAGYQLPKVVFWNLRAAQKNMPVKYNETGTALVSGFSASILTQLLSGGEFSPVAIMRQTIDSDRYAPVGIE